MPQVHTIATRPSSSVQEPRFALFIAIQYLVEVTVRSNQCTEVNDERADVPMREEHPPSEEDVRTLSRQPLKSLEDRRVHSPRAELVD